MRRLTDAQWKCLEKLAKQPAIPSAGWCTYGAACGVKRNVVRALAARDLAELDDTLRPGVSARITEAGRLALREQDDG